MRVLDEQILRIYFRLEECQMQRLRFERLLHPEKFKWTKTGKPPVMSETKKIRLAELGKIGFGEDWYQKMLAGEKVEKKAIEEMAEAHPLREFTQNIPGFGLYLTGAFIAAAGDIERPSTCSSFWYGMGLDIDPETGKAPRRLRGAKVERKIPCFPHVSRIGEQIREQMLRQNPFYQNLYYEHKEDYHNRYPDAPPMFCHKHGLRIGQKVLYACLFREWRKLYGLPAPMPYVFDILKHSDGHLITIEDFYTKPVRKSRKGRAS